MDAIVSERLTSSPAIVDIYGFCGLSMMSEYLSMGDLMQHATPGGDRVNPVELNDSEDVDPQNYFSATEKLTLSLEMAEAIALLHSYKGGVIVHDDIQLPQFLASEEGYLKLNDFNRAEIMLWYVLLMTCDLEDRQSCTYNPVLNGLASTLCVFLALVLTGMNRIKNIVVIGTILVKAM
jgi:hypothetical protein